jgi:alpha-methylacyl-CoA racemase
MLDAVALFTTRIHSSRALGTWDDNRGSNVEDGGAHYYGVYETSDGKYVTVAAAEPKFYDLLVEILGLISRELPPQNDRSKWPMMRALLADRFRQHSRDEWCELFRNADACFAPVMSPAEAIEHEHNVERSTFTEMWGVKQPAPSPRFSRTPGHLVRGPARPGEHTEEVMLEFSLSPSEIAALKEKGVLA